MLSSESNKLKDKLQDDPKKDKSANLNNPSKNDQHDNQEQVQSVNNRFDMVGSIADLDPGSILSNGKVSEFFYLPLSWHKLTYRVGKKTILHKLTGTALPSRCVAILGSSGAGKTTFLNAICDRLATSRTLKLSGRRQLGDVEYNRRYRYALGFVTQDDIIASEATPQDVLWFSLRTRRGIGRKESQEHVNQTLEVLRLTHCKDTRVGVPGLVAGLSGGERKRCNIGVELICDPKVLMLDEPTSGLDSVTSAKIINLLRQLSRLGRTIIYTIHQPTAEVLSYFDDLILMTMGRCVYHGTMADSLGYFESIGFVCPEKYTPTDYYMILLQDTVTSRVLIKRWRKFLKNGKRTPHTTSIRLANTHSESSAAKFLSAYIKEYGSSAYIQFIELYAFTSKELWRDNLYLFALLSQALFFSIVVGLIFINLGDDVAGMQDRQGLLFMTVTNRAIGATFIVLNNFHNSRAVFVREQHAGAYSPFLYFTARMLAQFPLVMGTCLIECIILYFMTGLYASPGAFFYFFGVLALLTDVAIGLGFFLSAMFESLIVASAITVLILMPLNVVGGLFANTQRLRPYWYFLEKPSHFRHAYILLMRNEFKHIGHVGCDVYEKGDFYCLSQYHSGDDVLESLGFNSDPQSTDVYMWVSLAILWFLYRFLSVLALMRAARKKI